MCCLFLLNMLRCDSTPLPLLIGILVVLLCFVYFRTSVTKCGFSRPERFASAKNSDIKGKMTTRNLKDGQVIVSKILIYPIKVCYVPYAIFIVYLREIRKIIFSQSCRGISVQSIKYAPEGLENDRTWCIVDARTLSCITAKEYPKVGHVLFCTISHFSCRFVDDSYHPIHRTPPVATPRLAP